VIFLIENIWTFFSMILLLCASGFFSGAETAFFNLSGRQIQKMLTSPHKNQRLTAALLQRPKRLMTTLLLGNMAVNVFYFALTSTLALSLIKNSPAAAGIIAVLSFLILVTFGEMLPKSFAYGNSVTVSIIAAAPAMVCVYLFRPIRGLLNNLLVVPVLRLLVHSVKKPRRLSPDQFKVLIESSTQKGLISYDENQFLNAVIDMSILKVRHIMRPRVDMLFCESSTLAKKASEMIASHDLPMVFLYRENIDDLVGMATARQILLNPDSLLDSIKSEINFVPEQKNVESLLQSFLSHGYDTAVVVDEYGQIAGAVCLDDIIDNVIGTESIEGLITPIEQIGPMQYRLAGNLSIHNWAQDFGLDYRSFRFSTVAGLTAALLGKVPKCGDAAYLQNVKFTVEKVRRHRIESVILSFEPIGDD